MSTVIQLAMEDGRVRSAVAEDTGTPGLVIHPCTHAHQTPHWRLTHAPSGYALGTCSRSQEALRRVARRLARLGDWPLSFDAIIRRKLAEPEWGRRVARILRRGR